MTESSSPAAGADACVLYCHCQYANVIPSDLKRQVLTQLTLAGTNFQAAPDLCEMSARRDPLLAQLAQADDLRIAACHRRAVLGLFEAAGHKLDPQRVRVLNMREQSADQVLAGLQGTTP